MVQFQAHLIALLVLVCRALTAPMLVRPDEYSAELQLLYDPDVKHHVDDYGERPFPLPPAPHPGSPYVPNLEEEYY
ncbi:unnamed protein product [Tetraodon nigroviridis]|uniref:(spotted green pufferfish) hypothetical protein n=1 Tax=Tetraodon nigroviridis TaxID=99883 RepID=Q4SHC6_TETNG|nr:unnamed protein product [Tetraodon nigroviridis]